MSEKSEDSNDEDDDVSQYEDLPKKLENYFPYLSGSHIFFYLKYFYPMWLLTRVVLVVE
jgi:hypothetical protein